MAWFFSRKKAVSEEEFESLIDSIKKSFSNVKTDVFKIKEKTQINEDQVKEIHNIIGYLNQSLKSLNNKIDGLAFPTRKDPAQKHVRKSETYVDQEQKQTLEVPKPKIHILEKITSVQEEILKKILALSNESSSQEISAKDIAQEMYPESDYSSVRPMISNYLDILEEFGLLKKIRKRRQVFVTLTERGDSLIESFPQSNISFSRTSKNLKKNTRNKK